MVFLNRQSCNPSDEHCPCKVHPQAQPSLLGNMLTSDVGIVSQHSILSKKNFGPEYFSSSNYYQSIPSGTVTFGGPRYALPNNSTIIIPHSQIQAAESEIVPHIPITYPYTDIVKRDEHTNYTPLLIGGGLVLLIWLMMRK
ncbi:MAG: hypothetical protein QW478_01075 [Candidatus Micrarchaeaceae archaeon]